MAQGRTLPWRSDPTPYHVLLSEFMCQQTRVSTALPYFQRFVERWPDLEAFARADEAEVVEAWAGLGYYNRARRLLACARAASERGGLPDTYEALRELPGIGPYTAGAIASIAFGRPTPAIDGNVQRVGARVLALEDRIDQRAGREALRALVEGWHDQAVGHPGDLNQALMELGASICTPRSPRCDACPLSTVCKGQQNAEAFPKKKPRRAPRPIQGVIVVPTRGRRVLLVKRPGEALLGGLWSPPYALDGEPRALAVPLLRELQLPTARHLGSVRHVFSHRDLTAQVITGELQDDTQGRWVAIDEPGEGLSALAHKALQLARERLDHPLLLAAEPPWSA